MKPASRGRRLALRAGLGALALAARPPALGAQVDPTGSWRTIETAHFDVHVRAGQRDLALRAAGEAEAAYQAYTTLLPAPRSRIDLVVADNVDDANGYATTYPRPRIVIYAFPPAGDIQLEAYDRWLRLVVTHELAHIFHLDLARGWWSAGRAILGRAPFLFPGEYTPAWLREGLAVFYESRLTGAGRLEGSQHRAIVAAAAAEGRGMPLDEASTASPRWPSGLKPYAFGSRFMAAAATEHGDTVIARFITEQSGRPIPYLQLASTWRSVADRPIAGEWNAAMRADSPTAAPAGVGRRPQRQLLGRLRSAVPPRVAPDGSRLVAVLDDGTDAPHLFEFTRGGPARRLARLSAANGLAAAADGSVLVSELEYADLYTVRSDLYRAGPDGSLRRLTRGARLREADQAADGAVVAVRAVPGGSELVLASAGAAGPWLVLTPPAGLVEWATPRFSPDGALVAAVRVDHGWHDIVLLDRTGSLVRQVTRDSVADLMPAFTPDGRWLLWSREIGGVPQIVGLRLDGAAAAGAGALFTDEPFAAYAPAPANDSLFYLSYHADGYRLVAVALDGTTWPLPALSAPPSAGGPPPPPILAEHDYRGVALAVPRYWLPQLYGEPGGGWVGAFTSGADPLERHVYSAALMLGLGGLAGQWNGRISWAYAGPGRALLDASASHTPRVAAGTCCDPDDELHAGVSVVRRRWRWQALVRAGAEYTSTVFADRVGASLTGSLVRTVTPPLSVSTQSGARLSATLRYRHRTSGPLESAEFTVRGSAFASRPTGRFARRVLAARVALGGLTGGDPIEFGVGGVSSAPVALIPGVALGGGARTFPVRGLPPGQITGRRALGASVELREPVALVGRGPGLFPFGLDRISAALFADLGMGWSANNCAVASGGPGGPLCRAGALSLGPELATDVVVGYDVPIRVRLGWARVIGAGSAAVRAGSAGYLSIGTSF